MSQTGLATAGGLSEIDQLNGTIIVVPVVGLRELAYQRIVAGAKAILDLLNGTSIKNVVLIR